MATVPTFDDWTALEDVTAEKMKTNVRDPGNFFRRVPSCILRATAAQNLTTGADTKIAFDVTARDTDGMADLAGDRIVIRTAGLYIVSGNLVFNTNATGYRRVTVNAGAGMVASSMTPTISGVPMILSAGVPVELAVDDAVTLNGIQTSGGTLATLPTFSLPSLAVVWAGA